MIMANIVNVTATFTIRGPISIPNSAKYKYYVSKKSQKMIEFPGAVYKKFGHTFILYKSGKIICVGGKDIRIIEKICSKVAKIISGMSRIYDFKINNLVACLSLGNFLDLENTAESIKSKNSYMLRPRIIRFTIDIYKKVSCDCVSYWKSYFHWR